MKLLIMQFSPLSRHFISLRTKYSPFVEHKKCYLGLSIIYNRSMITYAAPDEKGERKNFSFLFSHIFLKIQKFNVSIHVYVCTYDCAYVRVHIIISSIFNNGCDLGKEKLNIFQNTATKRMYDLR
jgi:hypothetical protein